LKLIEANMNILIMKKSLDLNQNESTLSKRETLWRDRSLTETRRFPLSFSPYSRVHRVVLKLFMCKKLCYLFNWTIWHWNETWSYDFPCEYFFALENLDSSRQNLVQTNHKPCYCFNLWVMSFIQIWNHLFIAACQQTFNLVISVFKSTTKP